MVMFGLVVTVRMLFPEWYAVPGALMQMTSQNVPAVSPPSAPLVQLQQHPATSGEPDQVPVNAPRHEQHTCCCSAW